jgi:hypothetical protein
MSRSRTPGDGLWAEAVRCGAAALAAALLLSGCVGYRLGTSLPPDIHSIHIPAFVNDTSEPRLDTEATRACVQEFQRDGTLDIAGADTADLILDATLTYFRVESIRSERDNVRSTAEYRARIGAKIVVKKRALGTVLLEKKVEGEATFEPGGDMASAKRQALPTAAKDLAHDIVESVVEFW